MTNVPESGDSFQRDLAMEESLRENSLDAWCIVAHTLRGDLRDAKVIAGDDDLALAVAVAMIALFTPGLDDADALPRLAGLAARTAAHAALAVSQRDLSE